MRARVMSVAVLVLALAGVGLAPGTAGAAEPVLDLEIVSAPTGPAAVGDVLDIEFRPSIDSDDPIHELEDVTVAFDLPAELEVHDTYSQGDMGNDRHCQREGSSWTCTDWAANYDTWRVRLVAVSSVANLDLTLTATSVVEGVAPVTRSVPITITDGVTDATVSASTTGGSAVGDPMSLWVSLANHGPRLVVGATVSVELTGDLVVDPDVVLTPAFFDPFTEAGWSSGTCAVSATTVTCTDVNLYPSSWDWQYETERFLEVRAVPTASGPVGLISTIAPGPHQAEPDPDPSPNTWSATHTVAPATDGTLLTVVLGTDGLPVEGAAVAAFAPADTTTPTATGATDGAGQVVLPDLPGDDYALRLEAPGYAEQWYRGDGTASGRATAEAVSLPTTGDAVTVTARLEDLDTTRVDLGGGTFGEPDVVVVGDETSLRITPGVRRWRVDGSWSAAAQDTTFTVATPPSVEILSASQYRGPGGGDPVGTCDVEAHLVTCSLPDTDLDVLVDIVATAPGSAAISMTHVSALTESVPDGLPATREQAIDVIASTATLSGRVVGPDDSPVEGAHVWAYLPTDGLVPATPGATGVTGPDGSFTLDEIPLGTYAVLVHPTGESLAHRWLPDAPTRTSATPITLSRHQHLDVGTIALSGVGSISGTVADTSGPVEGATVAAVADGTAWLPAATATTGPDGSYSLDGLPGGTYQVRVAHPSGGTTWYGGTPTRAGATPVILDSGGAVTGVDVSPLTTTTVSGTVTAPDGPVEGALVWLYGPDDTWLGSRAARTGPDGTFTVAHVPADTYLVRVVPESDSGWAPRWFDGALIRGEARPVVVGADPISGIDVVLG